MNKTSVPQLDLLSDETKQRLREPIHANSTDRDATLDLILHAAAVAAEDRQSLFYRDGVLVSINGDQQVAITNGYQLQSWLWSNGVKFYTTTEKPQGSGNFVRVDGKIAPLELCRALVSLSEPWRELLQPLDSVTAVPYFRTDGTVITERGYYRDLRLFSVGDFKLKLTGWGESKVGPSGAEFARKWIETEIFGDFHFASPADKANAIGAPLALLTRYIHNNVLPFWGFTAYEAGTGKGHCSKAIRTCITPDDLGVTGMPENETEMQKVVGSLLLTPQPVISFDNVKRGTQVTSETLCRLATATRMQTRTLGQSKIPAGVNDKMWCWDGNNISPGEDLVRRYIEVRLTHDSKDPALDDREFRHPELIGFINENRGKVLAYYLMMYTAWREAGSPKAQHSPSIDSYNPMIEVVAGVLEYAGLPGFWSNMTKVREDAMSGSDEEANFNTLDWIRSHPNIDSGQFSSADIIEVILTDEAGAFSVSDMKAPLPQSVAAKWHLGQTARSTALTKYFRSIEEQRFGNDTILRVVKTDNKAGNKVHFRIVMEVVGDSPDLEEMLTPGVR